MGSRGRAREPPLLALLDWEERLAEALEHPEDRDAAASAIRGPIERIVLTPSEQWAEMDAVLHGDLGAILEWAGNGRENTKTDIPMPEMSVSVVAGLGFEPATGPAERLPAPADRKSAASGPAGIPS